MIEATYVLFVPKTKRAKLRSVLQSEDTSPLTWREKRSFSGSEFYFSGPATLARETHLHLTRWLSSN
jgi:hypothetical protein